MSLRIALFCLLLLAVPARAAEPSFPELTGRVVDGAEILPPETEAALTRSLAVWEERSSDQIVIVTVPDLQGLEIEEYGYRLGRAWGIGVAESEAGRALDNGALLIVAPNERAVRIEVGYGLEPELTDAVTSTILRRAVLPRFREGDYAGGVTAGAEAMIAVLSGEGSEWQDRRERAGERPMADGEGGMPWPLLIFVLLFVLPPLLSRLRRRRVVFDSDPEHRRHRRHDPALDSLAWIIAAQAASGGRRGGFSSGGGFGHGGVSGGFTGGGGSFGGGGASGSW
ncbi:TPM domain-containing protein [Parvularcula oceani]|uniref:TPM domain-containing protein n=1 Tax=Parvularcula oceani TaxID=1247963 RepID=UPI00068F84A8|nr:TPM domain-containing protein [Parvularcula oceani]